MIKFLLILLSELDHRGVNELVHGLTPITTEATYAVYLYDDWFPSVIQEVLCHGRVAGRVVFTVLDVTPSLQLQRQVGDKCALVVVLLKRNVQSRTQNTLLKSGLVTQKHGSAFEERVINYVYTFPCLMYLLI